MSKQRQIISDIVYEIKSKQYSPAALKNKIKKALNQGLDLNTPLYRGRTLMHYAVKANAKGVVRILDQLGVNANICDDDFQTPLHYAITLNRFQAIKELLKIAIDINAGGEFEQTPLHLAVTNGNLDIIRLLISHGADISIVDENNQTAYDYALDEKDEKIIMYLERFKGGSK